MIDPVIAIGIFVVGLAVGVSLGVSRTKYPSIEEMEERVIRHRAGLMLKARAKAQLHNDAEKAAGVDHG